MYTYIVYPSHFNAWAGEHVWDIALPRSHVVCKHFSSGIWPCSTGQVANFYWYDATEPKLYLLNWSAVCEIYWNYANYRVGAVLAPSR